jgi:septal ring factor EnvC (AmiA/AmiB activator)
MRRLLFSGFLLLLLSGGTGCVTQQRYADVLREVEQKEKQQRKLETQLQALRAQNERIRDSLAIYPD